MVQRGRGFGFALEAAEGLGVMGKIVGKKFESDVAAEFEVFGFVDDSHAPAADFAEDAVMGDCFPHGLGVGGHWEEIVGRLAWKVNRRTGSRFSGARYGPDKTASGGFNRRSGCILNLSARISYRESRRSKPKILLKAAPLARGRPARSVRAASDGPSQAPTSEIRTRMGAWPDVHGSAIGAQPPRLDRSLEPPQHSRRWNTNRFQRLR